MRVVSAGIMVMLALFIAACGGSSASSSTGSIKMSVQVTDKGNGESYKPSVVLECVEAPCGSNPSRNEWRGYYHVVKTNFPANTEVVIVATDPNHETYPYHQYTPPGEAYGVKGNIQYTDKYGLLPKFKWSTYNVGGQVDPPGLYHLTFYLKAHGKIAKVTVPMKMARLH